MTLLEEPYNLPALARWLYGRFGYRFGMTEPWDDLTPAMQSKWGVVAFEALAAAEVPGLPTRLVAVKADQEQAP